LRQAPISFVISSCLSGCRSVPVTACISAASAGRISVIYYCGLSRKSAENIQRSLKSNKNIARFVWRTEYVLLKPRT
jgi:hypothetical protein